jgi:hypothetical protein
VEAQSVLVLTSPDDHTEKGMFNVLFSEHISWRPAVALPSHRARPVGAEVGTAGADGWRRFVLRAPKRRTGFLIALFRPLSALNRISPNIYLC